MKKQALFYSSLVIAMILYPFAVFGQIPNDPHFEQWAFEHTGVYDAWDVSTGSDDVIVAIIDNGFDTYHPDLRDNVWVNKGEIPRNGIDDDNNGYIDDINGWNFLADNNNPRPDSKGLTESEIQEGIIHHGTLIAGIIGAKGNNKQDGAGINWNVQLMNLKVLGNNGAGDLLPTVDAIYYAVDNGADVINISMVGDGAVDEMYTAVKYAYGMGVVVVAAAGNNMQDLNESPLFPICLDEGFDELLLGVSAINENHNLATFSNIGSECIDITAPGVAIQSTLRFSPKDDLSDTYSTNIGWDGTSFAAPFIAGAAALIKSVQPLWDASQVFDALFETVHHTPGQDEDVYANLFGAGLLQVDRAVQYAAGQEVEPIDYEDIEIEPVDTIDEGVVETIDISDPVSYDVSSRVMYIAPSNGTYEIKSRGKEDVTIKNRLTFRNIQDITGFVNDIGQQRYAAVTGATDESKQIYIYDEEVRFMYQWTFDKTGTYDIAVGDIDGDYFPEVILAPQESSTHYFYVYSVEGEYMSTYSKPLPHQGAIVDLVYNTEWDMYDIMLLFTVENDTYVEQLAYDFYVENQFVVEGVKGGEIVVFDIDQDGVDEYVIGAAPGKQAFIYVIEQDGTESYRFRGYPSFMKDGMDMAVIDYADDGSYELVLTPRTGGNPVRIMSATGGIIESWWPLGSADIGRVFAISLQ